MIPRLPVLVLLAAALGLAGCSHYQLGTGAAPAFATLYVAPVANQTLLPQAQTIVSSQLRTAFTTDGRITLVNSAAEAHATLTVIIHDYHRDVAAAREDDTGLARKFTIALGATCTLRDNRSGLVLFSGRPVTVHRDAYTDSGQLQSEYQTLPLLAETLAQKISHTVLDTW